MIKRMRRDESSLDQYLDDDPEGFMNEWGDYKRTPVNMKMTTHIVSDGSNVINMNKNIEEDAKNDT